MYKQFFFIYTPKFKNEMNIVTESEMFDPYLLLLQKMHPLYHCLI